MRRNSCVSERGGQACLGEESSSRKQLHNKANIDLLPQFGGKGRVRFLSERGTISLEILCVIPSRSEAFDLRLSSRVVRVSSKYLGINSKHTEVVGRRSSSR